MTIGNIPKDVRRKPSRHAQVLIGYLPTSKLEKMENKAGRRRALANVFHACMNRILAPLKTIGKEGIAMASGDGTWRRCHPIFATFVGDYPEQVLVAGALYGDCPKCPATHAELGDETDYLLRDPDDIQDVFDLADDNPSQFHAACRNARLKPIFHPFWEDLPYTNIYASITPDILHQMHQGVIKHIVEWVTDPKAFGAEEIDARCRRMPPNHNARLFTKGITSLSRVTGTEHKDMSRILLGLLVDLPLPDGHDPAQLIRAVRAILDFLYLAQYPQHTTETLAAMEEALQRFHDDKDIFIDLGIRVDFNLPKLHGCRHYAPSIRLFGTTDNYNTEQSERLHIDFTKDAYRATNHKDEYPQMTAWLERREKIQHHSAYMQWRLAGCPIPGADSSSTDAADDVHLHVQMTKHPTLRAVHFDTLTDSYGAADFADALADYIIQHVHPSLGRAAARREADNLLIPFREVPVFHNIKLWNRDGHGRDERETVHVRPARKDARGRPVPARFDMVLVKVGGEGISGCRVAQVRTVFSLPTQSLQHLFLHGTPPPPKHLAYIEWFTPFTDMDADSRMYRVSRAMKDGRRLAEVIPVECIERSVQLFPRFGTTAPRHWNSYNVLELCSSFRANPFLDKHTYMTVFG
ncbi:hypothetical protein OF83DRAFT_71149 [Amylostereum chailletii]|nr:hypothetical protein OF83DRAFT_71149 [Amylostereum chailletii]